MSAPTTVVFADLFGSTNVFETLGAVEATQVVTQVTAWIAKTIQAHHGRVVKMLGDGVLALFQDNRSAIHAVVELQRSHQIRMMQISSANRMPIRIGVASGDVEVVAGDCYGDAVNVAARLSELSGPHQIWVNSASLEDVAESDGVRFRTLGSISIRGRTERCTVYQVDWQEDQNSGFMTMQSDLVPLPGQANGDTLGGQIKLNHDNQTSTFKSFELPIQIGRSSQAQFVINDPRVSRTHARIDWRNGSMVLVDLSTYGCWVRFNGGGADLQLRRNECVLHGAGDIALGSSFSDSTTPTVSFSVS